MRQLTPPDALLAILLHGISLMTMEEKEEEEKKNDVQIANT